MCWSLHALACWARLVLGPLDQTWNPRCIDSKHPARGPREFPKKASPIVYQNFLGIRACYFRLLIMQHCRRSSIGTWVLQTRPLWSIHVTPVLELKKDRRQFALRTELLFEGHCGVPELDTGSAGRKRSGPSNHAETKQTWPLRHSDMAGSSPHFKLFLAAPYRSRLKNIQGPHTIPHGLPISKHPLSLAQS